MDELGTPQAWLLIGLPALVISTGLLLKRTPTAATAALLVLAFAFVALALIDRVSAGVFGGLLALLYAAGRGGSAEHPVSTPDWRRGDSA